MNISVYRALTTLLAVLGLADAVYLTDMALTGSALTCDIAGLDGCNAVAQSSFSQFLGFPLALYGVAFYLLFLLTFWVSTYKISHGTKRLVFLVAIAGAVFSTYFLYLQFFVIQALCIYCLGSAFIAYALTLLTGTRVRKSEVPEEVSS